MAEFPGTNRLIRKALAVPIAFFVFLVIGLVASYVRIRVMAAPYQPWAFLYSRLMSVLAIGQLVGLGAVLGWGRCLHGAADPAEHRGLTPVFVLSQAIVIWNMAVVFFPHVFPSALETVRFLRIYVGPGTALSSIAAVLLGYAGVVLWKRPPGSGQPDTTSEVSGGNIL